MLARVLHGVMETRALTIKFNNVEPNTLHPRPSATGLVLQPTFPISLSLRQLPRNDQRQRNNRKDNADGTIRPSPVGLVELVGQGGSSKSGDHIRRRGESVGQTTIPEGGSIRGNHIDGEDCTGESDRVECLKSLNVRDVGRYMAGLVDTYLGSTVSCDVVAAGHHNKTHDCDQHHDADSQSSIPQVQHLCDWHHASGA